MRIAIIGAGSVVFGKTLLHDLLATESLNKADIVLMAPSTRHTPQVKEYADALIGKHALPTSVEITTNRREALRDADFAITTFQIGGLRALESDLEIPLKHGVDQCIGDTLGPGGVFRAFRHIPVMLSLARDMEELCPDAYLLNYVNPMAMICWALGSTKVRFVGLCHGVQISLDLVSGYTGVPKNEITFLSAGINHMAWFLKLEHAGRDLYPELGGESIYLLKWTKLVREKTKRGMLLGDAPAELPPRSVEYGS